MAAYIQNGDRIRIHYTSRSLEGSVIETSERRDPFEFQVGSDEVITALNEGVIGLKIGDTRAITAAPERAFGRHSADLIQTVPLSTLPEEVQDNDQLAAIIAHQRLDVWVQRIAKQEAVVDANHPLAGETLVIDIRVVGHDPAS